MRTLELLAPAKNLACGLAAISHGADAVYIGADRFGARAAAGNSVDDIAQLCAFAHRFGARVYVTVNTIVYEQELDDTQQLITALSRIGVDALLVQDMATLHMRRVALSEVGYAPVLHASTQMDNRTAEKVSWLHSLGFTRAVLARELSVEEISRIHQANPDVELEVFVHGALCVSYSGQCYASQHCFGRSANRGACAQVCRMQMDLLDANGQTVVNGRYLLSMKDLCLIDHLEELADAGASSFKIEGRLKEADYVKNVVAAYSQRLNQLVARRPNDYRRASWGSVAYDFQPNLAKTFNRGYTTYFLHGRQPDIASMQTPKALGEFVGHVKELRHDSFNVAGTASFANGDGLCFINDHHELEGFRVNRAVDNRLYPLRMPQALKPGMALYRNNDEAFGKLLQGDSAHRTMAVNMTFAAVDRGFRLTLSLPVGEQHTIDATAEVPFEHQTARKPQTDNIRKQLSRLGNTVYAPAAIDIADDAATLFVPSSLLSDLRRDAVEQLDAAVAAYWKQQQKKQCQQQESQADDASASQSKAVGAWSPEYRHFPFLYNIANHEAEDFYRQHGLSTIRPALEVKEESGSVLMQCRYCLRYNLGYCVRHGGRKPEWKEPWVLRLGDGRRFRLEFRCDECQMNLYPLE